MRPIIIWTSTTLKRLIIILQYFRPIKLAFTQTDGMPTALIDTELIDLVITPYIMESGRPPAVALASRFFTGTVLPGMAQKETITMEITSIIMATNTSSTGKFNWSSTPRPDQPPNNIQEFDIVLSNKINEIKDNVDWLSDNLEACFNEKVARCDSRESDRYITNNASQYSDFYNDKYDTQFNSNLSSRYDNYLGTNYQNRNYTDYISKDAVRYGYYRYTVDGFGGCTIVCPGAGAPDPCSNNIVTCTSRNAYLYNGRYGTLKNNDFGDNYGTVGCTDHFTSYDSSFRTTVKESVEESYNSAENLTVCDPLS